MPYTTGAGNTRIHFRVVGDQGPYVVLLHGLGLSGRFWFAIPDRVALDDSNPCQVIVVDNRGTGRSECPRFPWRMSHMADDVVAVLDEVGARTAIVAGISMGGMIAQQVALKAPARVDGLVLMATTPGIPYTTHPAFKTLGRLVSLRFVDEETAGKRLARLLLPEQELPKAEEHLAGWREALHEEAAGKRGFLFQLGAVASNTSGFHVKKIRCPAVVMAGDQDVLVPPENSRTLARLIPDAKLEILHNVGHGIDILDKEAVRRAVGWLTGHA